MYDKMSNLCAGYYSVTVGSDTGTLIGIQYINITEPLPIVFKTSSTDATNGQSNGTASIDSTSGGYGPFLLFTWSNSVQGQTITGLSCGTYSVIATDFNGCTATSTAIVNCVTEIVEIDGKIDFSFYPNPATAFITIDLGVICPHIIQIINSRGEIIYSNQEIASNKIIVNVGILAKGIYIVDLKDKDNKTRGKQRLILQ